MSDLSTKLDLTNKGQSMKKQDGYYWVKVSETESIGYPNLISLIGERIGFIAYLAVCVIVSIAIIVVSL